MKLTNQLSTTIDCNWEDNLYFANKVYNYHRKLNHSASDRNAPGPLVENIGTKKAKASKVKRNQQPGLCNLPSQSLHFSSQVLAKDSQQQAEVEVAEVTGQSD